jgi:hypothetical protein
MSTTKFGPLQIGIILLTVATAVIHFSLLFPDPMFVLNGLGYLALLAAYFLPIAFLQKNHSLVRWAYIGYTLVTIIAWIVMGDKTFMLGYITKLIEVALIALLFIDGRK